MTATMATPLSHIGSGISAKLGSIAFALIITFGIFVGMARLIENDASNVAVTPSVTIGPIVFEEPPEHTITKTKLKPPPEQTAPPEMPRIESDPTPNATGIDTAFNPTSGLDEIRIDPTISHSSGGDARPLVRVEPKYPNDAATQGIEGWVKLSFTIAEDGSVTDVEVVEANPKRVFDRAAMRALKRWKYKPSYDNGSATRQTGMQVVLDFILNN